MPEENIIIPLENSNICDYHVHCDYSIDAVGTIEEYCESALKRGLAEICFTTHFDCYKSDDGYIERIKVNGKELPTTIENLAPYVDHVLKANDRFLGMGLSVKLGVEFGWFPGCEELAEKLKATYQFDYFMSGLHELDGICFCFDKKADQLFAKYESQALVEKYFQELCQAARTGLFDTLAHASYYLRYGHKFYGDEIKSMHKPFLEEFFTTLIANDCGLEINTAGLRHGHNYYYPLTTIINAAKKAGVSVEKIGSDAHHPSQVGFDFEVASTMIPDGFQGYE